MKKLTTLSLLLIAFFAVSITSVHAQSSPMLVTTPTQVNLTTTIGGGADQDINVKIAGLPLLATVTAFDITLQGADADQFVVYNNPPNLAQILQMLLGGGYNFIVSYEPNEAGPHQATLLINAQLLGVLMPVQTTIPLTGNTEVLPGAPVVISTNPVEGAQNVQANNPFIDLTYNQNITVLNASLITINGEPATNVFVEGNKLYVDNLTQENPLLISGITYTVVVKAGAIQGENGYATITDYSFSFATNDYPKIVSSNPPIGSTIYAVANPDEYISITFNFDRNIRRGSLGSIISVNDAFSIQGITYGASSVTLQLNNQVGAGVNQVPINFERGSVIDANSNQILDTTYTYYVSYNGTRNVSGIESNGNADKAIASEKIYTITGIQAAKDELEAGHVYIKKIVYEDGSVDTVKFMK